MKLLLKMFLNHKGRLNRKRYVLWSIALGIAFSPLEIGRELEWKFLEPFMTSPSLFIKILTITSLIFVILLFYFCTFNLTAKRFHDMNMSGKYYFALLIPGYNIYILFKLLFIKGTTGTNRFGTDPLYLKP